MIPKELVARVKAVLRRFKSGSVPAETNAEYEKCVEYPDLMINLTNYSVIYRRKNGGDAAKRAGALILPRILSQSGIYKRTASRPDLGL